MTLSLPPWPIYDEDDIAAAAEVLRSGRVNQWTGAHVEAFQQEYAAYVGCSAAIAVSNGTAALELALRGLGVGVGDEVIVPCRTFVATATAVAMIGARPIFADVDLESQVLTVETVAACVTARTRAVIVVHLAGWPADLPALRAWCDAENLLLIEDCAQAHGARVDGRPVGSVGHAGAFSFCTDKIISTGGEGGMITTSDPELAATIWSQKDHGRDPVLARQSGGVAFRWLTTRLGTNARLTELQALLGRRQLARLDDAVAARRRNASCLADALADLPAIIVPVPPANAYHSYYKLYLRLHLDRLRPDWSRDRILERLQAAGVYAVAGACPNIARESIFASLPLPDVATYDARPDRAFPVADALADTTLMFQVHPPLEPHMPAIADIVRGVIEEASQ